MELKQRDFSTNSDATYILIGNVNTGKSTIFNRMCRKNIKEGNYPGTTVSITTSELKCHLKEAFLIDTPGSNTIYGENEDELISKNMILDAKASNLVFVADSKNLKRSLALYFHYVEFDLPILFNINMMDEALIKNIDINVEKLASLLGVPVNTTVAIEGDGIESLRKNLTEVKVGKSSIKYPQFIENYLRLAQQIIGDKKISRGILLSVLAEDKLSKEYVQKICDQNTFSQIERLVEQTKRKTSKKIGTQLLDIYLEKAEEIYNQVVWVSEPTKIPFADKLGVWSRNIYTGIPIAIIIIILMYYFVGKFGAEYLVDLLEGELFGEIIVPWIENICKLVPSELFARAIVGEFGLVSVGLALSLGLVMPVLLTFYFFFGMLESSGYLPRLSVLLNKVFKKMGMSGKGILPLIMGFSCITMAILATRALETRKERNIATFLLIMGIPCAPLLSVMLVLLADLPLWSSFFIFGFLTLQILLIGFLTNKIFRSKVPDFIMEIPPLRIPKLKTLFINSIRRTYLFLKEAIPVFLFAAFAVFVIDEIGGIALIENLAKPILSDFVGLPKESVNVFLMSIIRREAGVALLTEFVEKGLFNHIQIIVNLLIITFLVPCINAILVIVKERGSKVAISIFGFVLIYAILMGALVNYMLISLEKIGII